MAGCTSDPTAGCDNSEIVTAIAAASASADALALAGNVILAEIKAASDACCIEINTNLKAEIALLEAINAKI
jgi:hypothetical protein